ncbi:hypothetical protein ASG67_07585 [Sphingomonas sp. Leaf339]|uniref:hypothetical protein n=1 Tax=Sphingomonas sp. Leaf339 TaxID=1736343 RepID=UPI000713C88A|nr:hypothetical protein [Sphingomonas sp. Leaf339]KQU55942.1 hypothetical protein ASG67_07585 [Sphingomonas sp. Leaf339]
MRRRPLLLIQPTSLTGLGRLQARILLGVLIVLVLGMVLMGGVAALDLTDRLVFDETLVERVRHGGTFYSMAAETLRGGGLPLRPALFFPVPTLPMIAAMVPPFLLVAALWLLAAAAVAAWSARLAPLLIGRPGRAVALVLLIAGVSSAVRTDLAVMPEVWAGLLIALSLAIRRPGRWLEAVALGLAAALLHGIAALYLIVMAGWAWRDHGRREAIGWVLAIVALLPVLALHGQAAAAVVGPLDAATVFWTAVVNPVDALGTLAAMTYAAALPAGVGAVLVLVSLIGWATWRDDVARRVATTLVVFLAAIISGGSTAAALLVAPVALLGLAFVPDLLRDLATVALDRRRITVTRLVR